jgi:hypothetical protein
MSFQRNRKLNLTANLCRYSVTATLPCFTLNTPRAIFGHLCQLLTAYKQPLSHCAHPMAERTQSAPPFCTRQTPVPPPRPLLVAQTDIFYHVLHPRPLLFQTPLPTARPFNWGPAVEQTFTKTIRIASLPPAPSSDNDNGNIDPQRSSPESEESDSIPMRAPSNRIVILKPTGENGRPGRGGYSATKVMLRHGWKLGEVAELKVRLSFQTTCALSDWLSGGYQDPL